MANFNIYWTIENDLDEEIHVTYHSGGDDVTTEIVGSRTTSTHTNNLPSGIPIPEGWYVDLRVKGNDFKLFAKCPVTAKNKVQLQNDDGDGIPPRGPDDQWDFWAHWYAFSGDDGDFGHSEDCPSSGHPLHVKLIVYDV